MVDPRARGSGSTIYDQTVPIYEFECRRCGERFEELVPAGTDSRACPACGAAGAGRRLTGFATTRQPTAGQKRRMEDRRGIDRGGARERFQRGLDGSRARRPRS
jgi:putative FmdB family regulatory protein